MRPIKWKEISSGIQVGYLKIFSISPVNSECRIWWNIINFGLFSKGATRKISLKLDPSSGSSSKRKRSKKSRVLLCSKPPGGSLNGWCFIIFFFSTCFILFSSFFSLSICLFRYSMFSVKPKGTCEMWTFYQKELKKVQIHSLQIHRSSCSSADGKDIFVR